MTSNPATGIWPQTTKGKPKLSNGWKGCLMWSQMALVEVNRIVYKAMADQLTTVSKLRFGERLGEISGADMTAVIRVIGVQLDSKCVRPW